MRPDHTREEYQKGIALENSFHDARGKGETYLDMAIKIPQQIHLFIQSISEESGHQHLSSEFIEPVNTKSIEFDEHCWHGYGKENASKVLVD